MNKQICLHICLYLSIWKCINAERLSKKRRNYDDIFEFQSVIHLLPNSLEPERKMCDRYSDDNYCTAGKLQNYLPEMDVLPKEKNNVSSDNKLNLKHKKHRKLKGSKRRKKKQKRKKKTSKKKRKP